MLLAFHLPRYQMPLLSRYLWPWMVIYSFLIENGSCQFTACGDGDASIHQHSTSVAGLLCLLLQNVQSWLKSEGTNAQHSYRNNLISVILCWPSGREICCIL